MHILVKNTMFLKSKPSKQNKSRKQKKRKEEKKYYTHEN